MRINVEENLIEPNQRNTVGIDNEMESFMETSEGENIKSDIQLLFQMGFDKKMINKVYILLKPPSIDRAIDYMTEVNGIYQHDFLESTNPKEKSLCFICKRPRQNHLDFIPDEVQNENDNLINNNQHDIIIKNDDDLIKDNINADCEVCYEELNEKEIKENSIPCGHIFCTHCWFNYLKTSIIEAKVENIKCMDHECNDIITEDFILKHLSNNKDLIDKYYKFKKRAEIINDVNKKQCPHPNCDSFLQKSEKTKYVKCENGHKYCFECLKSPHGDKSCDYQIEKQFVKWTKGKRVKRCPRCKMYTEKNEGCNHMTCVSCKYQWCWLCEGQYMYGHYDTGKCKGHQFTKADNLKDLKKYKKYEIKEGCRCRCGCGLFKLFPCVCRSDLTEPFHPESCIENYLFILGFWLFGIAVLFVYTFMEFYGYKLKALKNENNEIFLYVLVFAIGICMFVSFQIAFLSLISPFILICFIYSDFFFLFIFFFGMG